MPVVYDWRIPSRDFSWGVTLPGRTRSWSLSAYKDGLQLWRVFQPGEVAGQSGCQGVAEAIQAEIGGEVQQITRVAGRILGGVRDAAGEFVNPAGGKALGWSDHYVVVQAGVFSMP